MANYAELEAALASAEEAYDEAVRRNASAALDAACRQTRAASLAAKDAAEEVRLAYHERLKIRLKLGEDTTR